MSYSCKPVFYPTYHDMYQYPHICNYILQLHLLTAVTVVKTPIFLKCPT